MFLNKYIVYLRTKSNGAIAQLVEQRTENPCVPGSNPGSTTKAEYINTNVCIPLFFIFDL